MLWNSLLVQWLKVPLCLLILLPKFADPEQRLTPHECRWPHYICQSLLLQGQLGKWRLTTNLSAPKGGSVSAFRIQLVMLSLQWVGTVLVPLWWNFMWKLPLLECRCAPLRSLTSWKAWVWSAVDLSLTLWSTFSSLHLQFNCLCRGVDSPQQLSHHYLDDFIAARPPDSPQCEWMGPVPICYLFIITPQLKYICRRFALFTSSRGCLTPL